MKILSMLMAAVALFVGSGQALADPIQTEQFGAHATDGSPLGTVIVTNFVAGPPGRPIIFAFNGGPGASSTWLSLGAIGTMHIAVPGDPRKPIPADPGLVPNVTTISRVADIVLIDPLGTGFSRALKGIPNEAIFDWRSDGHYIADIIRTWLDRHHRRSDAIFLMGESYGTERAVAIADDLANGADRIDLRGVILVSQSISVENTLQRPGNDLGTAVGFPTIAATACYFRISAVARDPATCAAEAQRFSLDTYLPALAKGSELPARDRAALERQLAEQTGLPVSYFQKNGLELSKEDYRRKALNSQGLLLGMYDARYTAPVDPKIKAQDPSLDELLPAMTSAARRFYADYAGVERSPIDNTPYIVLDSHIEEVWRYGPATDPYVKLDMMGLLARALRRTGGRLFIAGGLFDTAASYGADRYLASHINLPRQSVRLKTYVGGHMFYFDDDSRFAFLDDVRDFVTTR